MKNLAISFEAQKSANKAHKVANSTLSQCAKVIAISDEFKQQMFSDYLPYDKGTKAVTTAILQLVLGYGIQSKNGKFSVWSVVSALRKAINEQQATK